MDPTVFDTETEATPPAPTRRVSLEEAILVTAGFLASVVVHSTFMINGFGEADAARMAVQALAWHETGAPIASYVIRTSPLYIAFLKSILDLGLPATSLPAATNWIGVILGAGGLVPLYFFWRRMSNWRVALMGCVIYCFVPAYWISSIYAMPHLYAFAFFVTAVFLYSLSLEAGGIRWALLTVGAGVCAIVAAGLKADVVLCFGAFLGAAFCARQLNLRNTAVIVITSLLSVITVLALSRWIMPEMEPATDFVSQWHDRWPVTMRAFGAQNALVPVHSMGPILYYAAIASLAFGLISRRKRRTTILVLLWMLPAVLMWSLRQGNSARHLMIAYAAAPFVIALAVDREYKQRWLFVLPVLQVTGLLWWNYISTPATPSTVLPGTRLVTSRNRLQEELVTEYHMAGRTFAGMQERKRLYFGQTTRSYVQWEVWARSKGFTIEESSVLSEPIVSLVTNEAGVTDTIMTIYLSRKQYTVDKRDNWAAWTTQPHFRHLLDIRDLSVTADSLNSNDMEDPVGE